MVLSSCALGACSAARYGAHLADVPIGSSSRTSAKPVGTDVDRQIVVDVVPYTPPAAAPGDPIYDEVPPDVPPTTRSAAPPVAADTGVFADDAPAPLPPAVAGAVADAPPALDAADDVTALVLACHEEERPKTVEYTHTLTAFDIPERLVYGLVMAGEAVLLTALLLSLSDHKDLEDRLVEGAVAAAVGVDLIGWGALVFFMPAHDHASTSTGPGRWRRTRAVTCPAEVRLQQARRAIPLVAVDGQQMLDDPRVVHDLLQGHPLEVTSVADPSVYGQIVPSARRACGWAADDQRSPRCDKPDSHDVQATLAPGMWSSLFRRPAP